MIFIQPSHQSNVCSSYQEQITLLDNLIFEIVYVEDNCSWWTSELHFAKLLFSW